MDKRALSNFALSDYLRILQSRLCPSIVSEENLARIIRLTNSLPGEVSTFFGLECPMEGGRSDADFLFCSTQHERHISMVAGTHPKVHLPESLFDSRAWKTVVDFCKVWEADSSDLRGGIHNMWLEFDVGRSEEPWDPSLFFGIEHDHHPSAEEVLEVTKRALGYLDIDAVCGQRVRTLERLFEQLPDSARVFQVGVMLSRLSPCTRVCIRGIEPEYLSEYLEQCGYSGRLDEMYSFIETIEGTFDSVALDLDVGARIAAKIGLEFSFELNDSAMIRLEAFLASCLQAGLTDTETVKSLLDFHFIDHSGKNSELWPEKLLKQTALFGFGSISFIAGWLHHVKVDFYGDRLMSAKAYLAMESGRMKIGDLVSLGKNAV